MIMGSGLSGPRDLQPAGRWAGRAPGPGPPRGRGPDIPGSCFVLRV